MRERASNRPEVVCILSSGRKHNDERIYYKIARSLRKEWETIVVVAPGGWDHRYDDGIEFVPIPPRRSRWNRIGTLRGLMQKGKECNASVYQCEEVDSWLIGWLLARRSGARLVYDAHEFDPAEVASGAPWLVRSLLWSMVVGVERFLARRTDLILVANQIVRGYFLIHNRFAAVIVLENAPLLGLFEERSPLGKDHVLLCHEGSLGYNRGLKSIVGLMEDLRRKGVNARLRIVGDVYGDERAWLERELRERGLDDCIEITGWLQYPDVGQAIAGCDLGLIAMQPIASNMLSGHPNKLFNYMRYGLAVVGPDFPEIKRIIEETGCGSAYRAGNPEDLARAVMGLVIAPELRSNMGLSGKAAVLAKYNWENLEPTLLAAYQRLRQ